MKIISDEQLDDLKIEKFIFHVIHHGEETPIFLDEVSVEGFEPFFIERIKDTLKGNQFIFLDNSPVEQQLREILPAFAVGFCRGVSHCARGWWSVL